MGAETYTNYLTSIQILLDSLIDSVEILEKKVKKFRGRVEDGINIEESRARLTKKEAELAKMLSEVNKVKSFQYDIKKRWNKPEDRVIGFVVWAPPINLGVAPHRYTHDLCVIELYKDKFKHMVGNVLSLGAVLVCLVEYADLNAPLFQVQNTLLSSSRA